MMFGLISAFFAVIAVAFADSDASWQDTTCAGVLAFLISMWIANFLFECDAMVLEIVHDRAWPSHSLIPQSRQQSGRVADPAAQLLFINTRMGALPISHKLSSP